MSLATQGPYSWLKNSYRAAILICIDQSPRPLTRRQIVFRTRVTYATVDDYLVRLMGEGLINQTDAPAYMAHRRRGVVPSQLGDTELLKAILRYFQIAAVGFQTVDEIASSVKCAPKEAADCLNKNHHRFTLLTAQVFDGSDKLRGFILGQKELHLAYLAALATRAMGGSSNPVRAVCAVLEEAIPEEYPLRIKDGVTYDFGWLQHHGGAALAVLFAATVEKGWVSPQKVASYLGMDTVAQVGVTLNTHAKPSSRLGEPIVVRRRHEYQINPEAYQEAWAQNPQYELAYRALAVAVRREPELPPLDAVIRALTDRLADQLVGE